MSNKNTELPHRDHITAFQINTLLNVAGSLIHVLRHPEPENIPQENKLDGGVKTSAETTLINVCNRLDEIVGDPDRWTFKFQEHLEYKLGELYQQEINLKHSQIRATEEVNSPHFIYKPTLVRLQDGTYAAILGDLNNLEKALCGVGVTPAEAMKAFDEAFRGEPSKAMVEWLDKQEKQDEPEQQVDSQGTKTTGRAKRSRKDDSGNSGSSGKNIQGS